jgi:hypothetical protein
MKDERFTLPPAVVNHFAEKNHVIASVEFTDYATDEVSCGAFQERATFDVVAAIDFGEPVGELRRKSARQVVLIRRQDINREMACFGEI